MYLTRVGAPFWTASLMVLAAVAVLSTPTARALPNSRCMDKALNNVMKYCSTRGTKHKRSVEILGADKENEAGLLLSDAPDLPIQTFEPDSNKAYAKRQLQRFGSDVAMPMSDNEAGPNDQGDEHGPRFFYRGHHRHGFHIPIGHLIKYGLPFIFPADDPELDPLNDEEFDDMYNDLVYERSPRGSKEKPGNLFMLDSVKCCSDVRACRKEIIIKLCSRP